MAIINPLLTIRAKQKSRPQCSRSTIDGSRYWLLDLVDAIPISVIYPIDEVESRDGSITSERLEDDMHRERSPYWLKWAASLGIATRLNWTNTNPDAVLYTPETRAPVACSHGSANRWGIWL